MTQPTIDALIDLSIEYGEAKSQHDFWCEEMSNIAQQMGELREQLLGASLFSTLFASGGGQPN